MWACCACHTREWWFQLSIALCCLAYARSPADLDETATNILNLIVDGLELICADGHVRENDSIFAPLYDTLMKVDLGGGGGFAASASNSSTVPRSECSTTRPLPSSRGPDRVK